MNLYLVVSEVLRQVDRILDDGTGPTATYRIAEYVVAGTAAQAKYLACMAYSGISSEVARDITAMPRMTYRTLARGGPETEARIIPWRSTGWAEPYMAAPFDSRLKAWMAKHGGGE